MLLLTLLLLAPPAELPQAPDTPLEGYRIPIEELMERAVGHASKRARFDWRRGQLQLAALGGQPAELHNFESLRAGIMLRAPTQGMMFESSLSWVWVWGTPSTEDLALTPYRQSGRPPRLELDLGVAWPLAEGVVTPRFTFVPPAQLVLNLHAQLRYFIYPGGFEGLGFRETLSAIFSSSLGTKEMNNIADARLPGMAIDRARYVGVLGLGNDLYFQSGVFFGYRALVLTPFLDFGGNSGMGFGFEWDLVGGYAF